VEGPLTKQGYDMWADWTNGNGGIEVQGVRHKVRLQYQDDQSSPQMSAQIAERMLTEDHVQFLLAPYGSPPTGAVAGVAEKHRVPMVAARAGPRQVFMQGFHFTFGVLAPVDQFPQAAIDWEVAQTPRPTSIAIITADDDTSQLITKGVV